MPTYSCSAFCLFQFGLTLVCAAQEPAGALRRCAVRTDLHRVRERLVAGEHPRLPVGGGPGGNWRRRPGWRFFRRPALAIAICSWRCFAAPGKPTMTCGRESSMPPSTEACRSRRLYWRTWPRRTAPSMFAGWRSTRCREIQPSNRSPKRHCILLAQVRDRHLVQKMAPQNGNLLFCGVVLPCCFTRSLLIA